MIAFHKHKKISSKALPKFLAVLFVILLAAENCLAKVIINELQTGNKESSKNEFVELYNNSNDEINLLGFRLSKKTSSGAESNLVSKAAFFGKINPHEYFVISSQNYAPFIDEQLSFSGSTYSFAPDNTILLYDSEGILVDSVLINKIKDGDSWGRIDFEDFFLLFGPSPGKKNEKLIEIPPEPKIYPSNIHISEIYPAVAEGGQEFIELYNAGNDFELEGWILHDASRDGKYVFPKRLIKSKEYLVIDKDEFGFSLNDSGSESLKLFDPNEKIVSELSYSSAKKGLSYSFDDGRWRWTKFLTPGQENIFNNEPSGTLKVDKDVYVNVYANFEIKTRDSDGDKIKVTWNFGDGHKSYLAKTRHKYQKEGEYLVSVKMNDASEDVVREFPVNVKKYPHPKVRIVEINANPKGKDSDFETITIENKSKKKIDLAGWSIATGWKKFINHPISQEAIVKSGQRFQITRVLSKFSLNNSKNKIQLRYPDGKVAHEVKYKKTNGSIKEGEIFFKEKWTRWQWKEQVAADSFQVTGEKDEDQEVPASVVQEEAIAESVQVEKKENVFKQTIEVGNISLEKNIGRVLGAQTVGEIDGRYVFVLENPKKHYALEWFDIFITQFNSSINTLINKFIN